MIATVQVWVIAIAQRQIDPVQRLTTCGPHSKQSAPVFRAGSHDFPIGSEFRGE